MSVWVSVFLAVLSVGTAAASRDRNGYLKGEMRLVEAESQRRNVGVRSGSALGVHSDAFSAQRKHMEGRLSDLCAALTHFQPPIYHHGNLARSAGSLSQVSGHRDGFTSARFPFTPPWERLPSLLEDVDGRARC